MEADMLPSNPSPPTPATLKRPRPEPPSPQSSSSPKRAASEDMATGNGLDYGNLTSMSQPSALPSSPLRMECDEEQESSGWVARTGQVSLSEAGTAAPRTAESATAVYDVMMGSVPPPFTAGAIFYLIPKDLFTEFSRYALGSADLPPDFSVAVLQDRASQRIWALGRDGKMQEQQFCHLREGMMEDEDFMFLGAEGWDAMLNWYKSTDPSTDTTSVPRICLPGGRIEIAPNVYQLHIVSSTPGESDPILFTLPRSTTMGQLREALRAVLGDLADSSAFRVWTLDAPNPPTNRDIEPKTMFDLKARIVAANSQTLEECGFANGDALVVDIQNSKGTYAVSPDLDGRAKPPGGVQPLFSKPAMFSGNGESALSIPKGGPQTRSQSRNERRGKGLVGLSNLGNTCFMNSATQCLSNTQVLVDYFLTGVYREELNRDNPLGMHGQVAEAFGDVIENLWESPPHSSYTPRRLKSTCSRFAPQFAGYGQHDTQEFLAFLLDGLHEDLNRIKKKPYIEKPDWKPGGSDKELAELGHECWEGYKKRNDSVIVDLFQGQLQSTLVCPECHKESITMDPFMYLTVPLPFAQTRTYNCVYFPRDTEKPPVNMRVLVPANAPFSTVKEKIGQLVGAKGSNIIGFDLWKGGIYQWWFDSEPNTQTGTNDVAIFHEVGAPTVASHKGVGTVPTDGSVTVPVFTYHTADARSSYSRDPIPADAHLEPFFITLSKAEATDSTAIRDAIMRGYSRLVRPEHRTALWAPAGSAQAKLVEEEEEQVAEIHIDSSPRTSMEESLTVPSTISRAASSASLASQAGMAPRRDLFKVFVAEAGTGESHTTSMSFGFSKKDPNIQALYRATPQKASASWSPLDNRTRAKRHMLHRIGSSLSSLVGSAANSEDEGEGEAGPSALVKPGEGIFVQWKPSAFNDFFERNREGLIRELEEVVDPAIAKDAAKKAKGREISLDDCLDEFSKEETLGEDDLWYCPVCKKHQAATKKLDIYKAPDILVICLKRFGSSRTMRDKLDHLVQFPLEGLDLDERVGERRITKQLQLSTADAQKYGIEHANEPLIYDLYAVDNHFGGLGGGHYTAFCRNKEDDKWYNYDDSRVSKANPEAVQSRAAYLLFYMRRTARPIGGISRIKAEEASRAATPMASMPASPSMAAVNFPRHLQRTDSSDAEPGSPPPISPVMSDTSMEDVPTLPREPTVNLEHAGQAVGFGNTAWKPAVRDSFALGGAPLTPESEDGGFAREGGKAEGPEGGESGLGESYHVVQSGETSDAEMVSMPRSPTSE